MAKKSGTQLERFIMASVHQEVWIGLDVHKTSWHVAISRADGQACTFTTTTNPDQFVGQLFSWALNIKRVVYEAGPTGFVLVRACLKAGIKARGDHAVPGAAAASDPRGQNRPAGLHQTGRVCGQGHVPALYSHPHYRGRIHSIPVKASFPLGRQSPQSEKQEKGAAT